MKSALLTLLLAVFIALLGIGIIVPVIPVFATSLGASGLALGMIIAVFSITRGIFQPIVGSLSDRWGRKGFLVSGLLVYSLVGLLLPHAASVNNLIVIRAFHGLGSAMIVPVVMAYVSEMAPIGQEGRYMAYLNVAIYTGIGSGPLLGGFFTDLWGMASAFYVMAAASAMALLLILFQMPTLAAHATQTHSAGVVSSMRRMLANRGTSGLLLARMSTMLAVVPTMAFLPLLMHQWFSASGMDIGIVIACRTLVNAALQTSCGRLADRLDRVRLLKIGCAMMSGAICLVPAATGFWSLLVLFTVLGMGEAIVWPTLGSFAAERGRVFGQGTMMGVFSLAMSCGVFLGAIGAGACTDLVGLGWSFVIIGAIMLSLTMIAAGLIGRKNKDDH